MFVCMAREAEGEQERDSRGRQPQKKRIIFKSKPKKKAKRGTNFLCEISENMKRHKYVKMHGEIAEDTHTDKQTQANTHTLTCTVTHTGTEIERRGHVLI